ncbi:hypothetical protein BN946_scf184851.g17 [Trametes cinnabarina]|uniref:Uncharacterized protein n=1 Tax=Pycnoporus cinnabarinus TaxID=5643 RepID=A0A060SBF9_PYCCI|nr:hypothetical protein BN946_scf184851.g17 [Trametes cinnabarina]
MEKILDKEEEEEEEEEGREAEEMPDEEEEERQQGGDGVGRAGGIRVLHLCSLSLSLPGHLTPFPLPPPPPRPQRLYASASQSVLIIPDCTLSVNVLVANHRLSSLYLPAAALNLFTPSNRPVASFSSPFMAGYFSNHSQSRFLANSAPNASSTTTTTATTTAQSPATPAAPATVQARSRVTSSKHFSTSLSNSSADDKAQGKDKASGNSASNGSLSVHPLRNTWVFWFRQQRPPGNKITNYEEGIKKISAFSSVESFWSLWTHVHPPSSLLPTTDYLLFHSGIRRPVWEDPLNLSGGKWIIRLRKGVADRLWEDLVLAVIGDQFDGVADGTESENGGHQQQQADAEGIPPGEWPEICGCTISVRQNEDIISLWNRHDGNAKSKEKIKDTIRRVLNLPPTTVMEYKSNNDSMQDKSSFRVNQSDRTPLS